MTIVLPSTDGTLALPDDIRERYGLTTETPVRLIELAGGILLVPITAEPMPPGFQEEMEDWQAASAEAWAMFPYELDSK